MAYIRLKHHTPRQLLMAAAAMAMGAGLALAEPTPPDDAKQPPTSRHSRESDGDRPERPPGSPERGPGGPERGRGGSEREPGRSDRGPGGPREGQARPSVKFLTGTVEGYNLSPRGMTEGLMVKIEGKTAQFNLPPDVGAVIGQVAPVGEEVKLTAMPDRGHGSHDVYRLVMVTNSKGQQLGVGPSQPPKVVHVDGVVKTLNYARGGEINGAILESGDFVHVGPSAEKLKLAPGLKLSIDGVQTLMAGGKYAIDAQTVNGFAMMPPQGPGDRPGPREPEESDGPGGPPPGEHGGPAARHHRPPHDEEGNEKGPKGETHGRHGPQADGEAPDGPPGRGHEGPGREDKDRPPTKDVK